MAKEGLSKGQYPSINCKMGSYYMRVLLLIYYKCLGQDVRTDQAREAHGPCVLLFGTKGQPNRGKQETQTDTNKGT